VVATIRGLAALKRHYPHLRIDIGMTVHGLNYGTVVETADWVRANLPVDVLKPILVRGDPLKSRGQERHLQDDLSQGRRSRRTLAFGRKARRPFSAFDYLVHAKEKVSRDIIAETSASGVAPLTCAGGRETAVIYPTGDVAGCELRADVLGNLRAADFDFRGIWFGDAARRFRDTTGEVEACKGCYHHCFISPACSARRRCGRA
jgi:radical SAM protein with 4Fe4S-binding SPASM domain